MTSGMLLGKVERYSFVRGSGNNITLSKFIRGSSQGWNFEPGRGNTLTKSAVHFLQIELSHRTLLMNIQLSICKSRAGKKCGEVRLTEWCFIPPHIKRTMCLFLTGGEPREKMAGLLHERINAMFVFVRITKLALYKLYTICIRNWRIFHVLENLTSNFSLDLLGLLILFPRLEFSCRRMFTNFEENLKKNLKIISEKWGTKSFFFIYHYFFLMIYYTYSCLYYFIVKYCISYYYWFLSHIFLVDKQY